MGFVIGEFSKIAEGLMTCYRWLDRKWVYRRIWWSLGPLKTLYSLGLSCYVLEVCEVLVIVSN